MFSARWYEIVYPSCHQAHQAIQASVVKHTTSFFVMVCMHSMGNASSRSPRSRSPALAASSPRGPRSPTYSFESERPSSPTPPPSEAEPEAKAAKAEPEYDGDDSSCESSWHSEDAEREIRRELFGVSPAESPGDPTEYADTLTPWSLPSSLYPDSDAGVFTVSDSDWLPDSSDDDDWLLRPVPPMPSSLMPMTPPPPPPVQLVVSSSARALNITFNNCASASVIVHNHGGSVSD